MFAWDLLVLDGEQLAMQAHLLHIQQVLGGWTADRLGMISSGRVTINNASH